MGNDLPQHQTGNNLARQEWTRPDRAEQNIIVQCNTRINKTLQYSAVQGQCLTRHATRERDTRGNDKKYRIEYNILQFRTGPDSTALDENLYSFCT